MPGPAPLAADSIAEPGAVSDEQLREANERLVLASVTAQTMAEAAERAADQLREANENLVVATVNAQTMAQVAAEAAAHISYTANLEAQLLEAQKLETLGVLAGGVAHDFNNLLTAILGNANLGTMSAEEGRDVTPYFEAIEKAAMRAASLTRQLLAYAGTGKPVMAEVDFGIVAMEAIQVFTASLPRNVALHSDLAEGLPLVHGDATQIFQVLMNLITNAAEACPAGVVGRITIRTREETVDEAALGTGHWVLPLTPGRYASLEVADTGEGMTPELVKRAFEPFFTTKFTGRGLGLAAVMGIIRSHGGGLWVGSEPDGGSSFKIFMPALAGSAGTPPAESLPPVWRGEGQILVVDDELTVSTVARSMAEHFGFSVLEARDGLEAVELFRLHHGELAMVLMDLIMPGMDGQQAFREMRKIDRSVPVVLSSGYNVSNTDLFVEGLAGLLKKPYRLAEFQEALQRALAMRPSPG
ncbi:hybrid sensor histidine kinase/response regulator [Geothrix fuzhouensis]|uniref:hybrid sensor histidine kinase/response regulator n=1 Tax=Geothrix fuzhouensis TaxID=2966451 RepID=UPI002149572C|nr:ATP-binding protein [Geothrix fuzhouensis]